MTRKFSALDGLRGVAALAVCVGHGFILLGGKLPVRHAYLAVDFFFVLSGFVLAYAYEGKIRAGLSINKFLLVRFIRLFPMIAFGAMLGALAAELNNHPASGSLIIGFLAGLILMPVPDLSSVGYTLWPINPPSWSLFWEVLANIGFAVCASKVTTKTLLAFVLLSAFALVLSAFHWRSLDVGFESHHFLGGAARITFSFSVGMFLQRSYAVGNSSRRYVGPLFSLLVLFAIFGFPVRGLPIFDVFVTLVAFPAVVWFAAGSRASGLVIDLSGRLSYGVYLLHMPVMLLLRWWFGIQQSFSLAIVMVSLGCFLSVLLAWIVTVKLDEPLRIRLGILLLGK